MEDDQTIDTVRYSFENLRTVKGKTLWDALYGDLKPLLRPCSVDICGIITSFESSVAFESKGCRFQPLRVLTLEAGAGETEPGDHRRQRHEHASDHLGGSRPEGPAGGLKGWAP